MTADPSFKFDEIGNWSEIKLEIVEKYGAAYTTAFANFPNLKKYYIDGFSGAGVHVSKTTKARIEGSPARALIIYASFKLGTEERIAPDGRWFTDMNEKRTADIVCTVPQLLAIEMWRSPGESASYESGDWLNVLFQNAG